MIDSEREELRKFLEERYVLVPKNRWYYLIGGFIASVVIICGVSWATVKAALSSAVAEKATQHIQELERKGIEIVAGLPKLRNTNDGIRIDGELTVAKGIRRDGDLAASEVFDRMATLEDKTDWIDKGVRANPADEVWLRADKFHFRRINREERFTIDAQLRKIFWLPENTKKENIIWPAP